MDKGNYPQYTYLLGLSHRLLGSFLTTFHEAAVWKVVITFSLIICTAGYMNFFLFPTSHPSHSPGMTAVKMHCPYAFILTSFKMCKKHAKLANKIYCVV